MKAVHRLRSREPNEQRLIPIQAQTIPVLLRGEDLVGQAQTGTGKTAAFALPLLSQLDLAQRAWEGQNRT